MTVFATEFPVESNVNRAAFISEIIAWLRGTKYSHVLASCNATDLDDENVFLKSKSGEELRIRGLSSNNEWVATGFRHDNPDQEGRLWRTEGVLKRSSAVGQQDIVRLRTQCIAMAPGIKLESPRKPYLIKSLLKNGWGGVDLAMNVTDQPNWLDDSMASLTLARTITVGEAAKWLPTVYVSAIGKGAWLLDKREIEKLAYDLGGIAHVVVEPDRAFSFRLRDECAGKNAYGGTVALVVPNQGIIRRFFLGLHNQNATELAAHTKEAAAIWRGQMPTVGWDWTELQEQALRAQRAREKGRLSAAESEQLYQDEIKNLQERIRELEQQLSSRSAEVLERDESEFFTTDFIKLIGPEIYSGEILDRLKLASRSILDASDTNGLDSRSKAIFQRFVEKFPRSRALDELSQDIGRATKDPKRAAKELTTLLDRHGYREKSDNKHIRLEAAEDFEGLVTITVSKTPSDHRGLKNLHTQVEKALGLTYLGKK